MDLPPRIQPYRQPSAPRQNRVSGAEISSSALKISPPQPEEYIHNAKTPPTRPIANIIIPKILPHQRENLENVSLPSPHPEKFFGVLGNQQMPRSEERNTHDVDNDANGWRRIESTRESMREKCIRSIPQINARIELEALESLTEYIRGFRSETQILAWRLMLGQSVDLEGRTVPMCKRILSFVQRNLEPFKDPNYTKLPTRTETAVLDLLAGILLTYPIARETAVDMGMIQTVMNIITQVDRTRSTMHFDSREYEDVAWDTLQSLVVDCARGQQEVEVILDRIRLLLINPKSPSSTRHKCVELLAIYLAPVATLSSGTPKVEPRSESAKREQLVAIFGSRFVDKLCKGVNGIIGPTK